MLFGQETYVYYVRHLIENFLSKVAKLSIQHNASKNFVKEMFNWLAYALTKVEYDGVLDELRRYKCELA